MKGYAGDDGLFYAAVGVAHPVARHVFLQAEGRVGALGESGYGQITLGIGLFK